MVNWINSWRKGNKKDNVYDISIRIGRFTVLELYWNPGVQFKFLIMNFGIQI